MPSKIRGGTADKHLADMHIPRVSALGAGGGAAAFDPSSVAGYVRDWNFADITKLYTDTAGTLPVAADADPIGAILCSAGSTVKLAAPADASRGTYKTNIQNGLSVGRLDGSDDYWSNAAAITADASQTIIMILDKQTAVPATARYTWSMAAGAGVFVATNTGTGFNYTNNEAAGFVVGPGTPASWGILTVKYTSAAAAVMYWNGGAGTAFDPAITYSTQTNLTLAATSTGTGDCDWDIGRVLVYSAAVSDADLNLLHTYLGALWGITVTPVS